MWAEEQNQNLKSELFEYYYFAALQVFFFYYYYFKSETDMSL